MSSIEFMTLYFSTMSSPVSCSGSAPRSLIPFLVLWTRLPILGRQKPRFSLSLITFLIFSKNPSLFGRLKLRLSLMPLLVFFNKVIEGWTFDARETKVGVRGEGFGGLRFLWDGEGGDGSSEGEEVC